MSRPAAAPLVAVVAVHGVADQAPFATARTVADLLARTGEGGSYQAFQETAIRIRVDAAVPEPSTRARPSLMAYRQTQVTKKVVADVQSSMAPEARHPQPGTAWHAAQTYMTEQLSGYAPTGQDAVYDTIRLDSVRSVDRCRVHVYEAYWADLSRVKSGLLSIFLELYQLMFYVCSLGRKTVELARLDPRPPSRWWTALAWAHFGVEWPLTVALPIINLLLLAVALLVFLFQVPTSAVRVSAIAAAAVMAAIVTAFLVYLKWTRAKGTRWPVLGATLLAVAASVALTINWLSPGIAGHRTLGLIVLLLLEVIVLFLMAAYQQRRLGALPAAIAAVIAVTGGFVYALFTAPRGTTDEHAFVSGVMVTAEWLFVSLEWCWQVIVLAIIVTGVLAIIAPWRPSRVARGEPRHDPASRERLRRAALTATLSAVLPALIVLVLNIGLWNALIATGRTIVCAAQQPEARARVPSCAGRGFRHMPTPVGVLPEKADRIDQEGGQDVGDTVEALIKRSSAAFPLMLGFALIGAAIAVWALMPAVVSELPWLLRAAKWQAAWLGDAVSAGFKTLRWSGLILYALFLVLIASYAGVRVSGPISGPSWLNAPVLLSSIIALALTVSRGPFRFLALGFRSALDIALDVTNWLRMHPLHRNPRARICARYASLLRHVCEWQHPLDGSRYGAVVIVAHSQGTVITSELLAFLKKAGHPGLARLDPSHGDHLPVYLLTVGCPLRQLYGLRFPHLYAWARHGDASWPGVTPAPNDLGVRHWFNAYRSGDYVGRYLWHPDTGTGRWDDDRRAHPAHPAPPDLAEQCLGAGAHTHYFDETAAEVGVILDTLISAACHHGATPEIAQR